MKTTRHNISNLLFIPLIVFTLNLIACSKSDTVSDMGAELLSLKVESSMPVEVMVFNQSLSEAGRTGSTWAKDPISIIRRLINWGRDREAVMAFKGPGEQPRYYQFVVISNSYRDDSVQGERYDIELEQNKEQIWQVKSAKRSWRCWADRGHLNYSIQPCS